ncbi:hypothetical protein HY407_01965 [Candidatus Gottesmanbacteria bacterium]|nr:hypothetical protein [Candidatus Gottesmanbacteria bacterium]
MQTLDEQEARQNFDIIIQTLKGGVSELYDLERQLMSLRGQAPKMVPRVSVELRRVRAMIEAYNRSYGGITT